MFCKIFQINRIVFYCLCFFFRFFLNFLCICFALSNLFSSLNATTTTPTTSHSTFSVFYLFFSFLFCLSLFFSIARRLHYTFEYPIFFTLTKLIESYAHSLSRVRELKKKRNETKKTKGKKIVEKKTERHVVAVFSIFHSIFKSNFYLLFSFRVCVASELLHSVRCCCCCCCWMSHNNNNTCMDDEYQMYDSHVYILFTVFSLFANYVMDFFILFFLASFMLVGWLVCWSQ